MGVEGGQSEHDKRFRRLIENLQEEYFVYAREPDGRISYVGPSITRVLGYLPEEFRERFTHYLTKSSVNEEALRRARQEGEEARQATYEVEILHRDGSLRWLEVMEAPVAGESGEPGAFEGIARDVTARKEAEASRRQTEEQEQQAQKIKSLGVMAGGIAHDFNNLLQAILGNADLLCSLTPSGTRERKFSVEIRKAAGRAAVLSGQMLAYSGHGRFVSQDIDLHRLVNKSDLEAKVSDRVTFRFDPGGDDSLPPVEGDPEQLRQVVYSLVINAAEALGEEGGEIAIATGLMRADREYLASTFVYEDQPEGDYVFLEVADRGCGMEEEMLDQIFDPFFTTKFTGRGLGLAATLGVVRSHKGAIKVESEPDWGTRVRVLFPALRKAPLPAAEQPKEAPAPRDGREKGTILLVDDEECVIALGQSILEQVGFSILTAEDGLSAIEIVRDRGDEIACVLLDLGMPGMSGEETLVELRRIRADLPVIVSSGYSEQEVANRFAGQETAGFISKPYLPLSLVALIREVLG